MLIGKRVFVKRSLLFFGPVAIPPHSFLSEPMLRLLLSFSSSPLSPACPPEGGNRLNWTNFETPSFLAILRDPAGDPHRAGRSGGVWQVRSCIAFSQTLHGPRGFPRDWVSKLRAFEHCRFSSFQTSVRSSVVYPLLPAGHEAL